MRTSDRQFRKDPDGGLEDVAAAREPVVPRTYVRPVAYPARHRKTWRDEGIAKRIRAAFTARRGDHR